MRVLCGAMALLLGIYTGCPAAIVQPPADGPNAPARLSDGSFGGPRAVWYGEGELLLTLANNDINQRPSSLLARQNHIEEPGDGPLGTLIDGDPRYKKLYEQLAAVPVMQLLWTGVSGGPGGGSPPAVGTGGFVSTTWDAPCSNTAGFGGNETNFSSFSEPPPPPPMEDPARLTPVPEPSTGILLGLAAFWTMARRKRQVFKMR